MASPPADSSARAGYVCGEQDCCFGSSFLEKTHCPQAGTGCSTAQPGWGFSHGGPSGCSCAWASLQTLMCCSPLQPTALSITRKQRHSCWQFHLGNVSTVLGKDQSLLTPRGHRLRSGAYPVSLCPVTPWHWNWIFISCSGWKHIFNIGYD